LYGQGFKNVGFEESGGLPSMRGEGRLKMRKREGSERFVSEER
jgi:hypothetical protein